LTISGRPAAAPATAPFERARTALPFLLLGACVFVSRLPWIFTDYGADPDAYRVVAAAEKIAETGRYVESRLPGYPIHELGMALLVRGGPAATNGATAAFSAAAAVLMALIMRHVGVSHYLLGCLAFALAPVVYIASTSSIDYVWAMAFVLAATYAVLRVKPVSAGALMGVAVGCRLTSGIMVAPLAVLLWSSVGFRGRRFGAALTFGGVAAAVGLACFLPVWERHGLAFLTFTDLRTYPPLSLVLSRAVTGVWGTVGTAGWCAVLVMLLARRPRGWRLPSGAPRRQLGLCLVAILLYVAAYVRLPLESGYLLPVVPFAVIGLGLVAPPPAFRVLCLALCLSPFVHIGRSGLRWGGPLWEDHASRIEAARVARGVVKVVSDSRADVVVVCGSMQPRILAEAHESPVRDRFVYLVEDERMLTEWRRNGRSVWFVAGADRENLAKHGVELRGAGATELALPANAARR
jgi:hypothetical protein